MSAARVMQIPTAEEVANYAGQIGFKLDGGYFVDYWEARGWLVKPGLPMRDWRAAVRNWKRMEAARAGSAGGASPAPASASEIRRREAAARRAEVVSDAAGRIRAMMSWIKSGKPCPWASDPQAEIDAEVAKIRDHYGPQGVQELRDKVKELGRKKP